MFISRLKFLQQNLSGNSAPPAPFVAWTNPMSVEVKLLDNDHKKLLILLSELHEGTIYGYARQILEMIFEKLMRSVRQVGIKKISRSTLCQSSVPRIFSKMRPLSRAISWITLPWFRL